MTEEATETTETTETTTETKPVSMTGEDGNFVKDWHKLLKDESLHEDKTLQTFKNVEGLAKSYVHVRRQVPLDKIAIPNENTTDEEWEKWHEAGGRPPTAVDYNLVRPKDFPEEHWDDERANKWMERFHKAGLNTKQVAYLSGEFNADILEELKAQVDAINAYQQESKDSLFKRWGAAYEPKKHQGNYAIEKGTGGDVEFKERLLNMKLEGGGRLGDHPDFVEYNSNIGGKFAEHGDIVTTKVSTPDDIQKEISKEMATEAYKNGRHPDHKAAVKRVSLLFQEKNKATTTGR
jgi:hypothetical protein